MKQPGDIHSLKEFLDLKVDQYNRPEFVPPDPIAIPHLFLEKKDIEIAGFLTAVISWGRRENILKSALRLIDMMGREPYEFIKNSSEKEVLSFEHFVHRTFKGEDCMYFIRAIKEIYQEFGSLESAFTKHFDGQHISTAITGFRMIFFALPHPKRTEKHLADPSRGASAKRINMFLRWMVREDERGVDFGLWKTISPAHLQCPLDIHSGNVARKLGLLERKQNDWSAVRELTENLKQLDPEDPVKYDYALFGLGIYENF